MQPSALATNAFFVFFNAPLFDLSPEYPLSASSMASVFCLLSRALSSDRASNNGESREPRESERERERGHFRKPAKGKKNPEAVASGGDDG